VLKVIKLKYQKGICICSNCGVCFLWWKPNCLLR